MLPVRFFAFLILLLSAPAAAQWDLTSQGEDGTMVTAALVSDHDTVTPGQSFYVGLQLEIPDGWHTYWRNSGDSGEPTRIDWTLPAGFAAGDIIWPAPDTFPFGPLTNYGYAYEVVHPVEITASADAAPGFHTLYASVTWLVCEEICIPESAELEAYITVGPAAETNRIGTALINRALDQSPQAATGISAGISEDQFGFLLTLQGELPDGDSIRDAYFYPFDGDLLNHSAEQEFVATADGLAFRLSPATSRSSIQSSAGALTFDARIDGRWIRQAIEIAPAPGQTLFRPDETAFVSTTPVPFVLGTFLLSLVLAFLGGLILNLMPCVFPVLSIKALGFVERAHSEPGVLKRHGLVFLVGVLTTFVGLAVMLVALKALGQPIGWGFQLQSPIMVSLLALLFAGIGLNLLGAFEIGTSLQSVGGKWANLDGDAGAFMTGLLAVVVAAPCIGPFAAGALSIALVQPAPVMIAVSAMMGLGLAAPYVALSFFPALLRYLPKPGVWMDRFKQFLAFPMFGAAVWLVWVASIQTGSAGLLWLLGAILLLGFLVWTLRIDGRLARLTTFTAAALIAFAVYSVSQSTRTTDLTAEAWSPQRVAALRAENRAIFIDFTAAWCVTCQFNKQTTLANSRVQQAFEDHNVEFLVADWTNRDDTIANAIRGYGAAGVPLYVVYPADGGEAVILPAILSNDLVIEALENAAGN